MSASRFAITQATHALNLQQNFHFRDVGDDDARKKVIQSDARKLVEQGLEAEVEAALRATRPALQANGRLRRENYGRLALVNDGLHAGGLHHHRHTSRRGEHRTDQNADG